MILRGLGGFFATQFTHMLTQTIGQSSPFRVIYFGRRLLGSGFDTKRGVAKGQVTDSWMRKGRRLKSGLEKTLL